MFIKTTVSTWVSPNGTYRVRNGELVCLLNTDNMTDIIETSEGCRLQYIDNLGDSRCIPSFLWSDLALADVKTAMDTWPLTFVLTIGVFPKNDTTKTAQSTNIYVEDIIYIQEITDTNYCWVFRNNKSPVIIDEDIDTLDALGLGVERDGFNWDAFWAINYPYDLSVNVQGDSPGPFRADLGWLGESTEGPFVDFVIIERSDNNGVDYNVIDTILFDNSGSSDMYTDEPILSGLTYYYRIRFKKGYHYSEYSDVVSVTVEE